MLLPQVLSDFITTLVTFSQALGTSKNRAQEASWHVEMDAILMVNAIVVAAEVLGAAWVDARDAWYNRFLSNVLGKGSTPHGTCEVHSWHLWKWEVDTRVIEDVVAQ